MTAPLPRTIREEAIRLIQNGLSDRQTSSNLGNHHSTVSRWRKIENLPINTEAILIARQKNVKLAKLKQYSKRRSFIESRGWPVEITLKGVQIIEELCDRGPCSKRKLIGDKPLTIRTGKLLMSHLRDLGLVIAVRDVPTTSEITYFPTMVAIDIRRTYIERQNNGPRESERTS